MWAELVTVQDFIDHNGSRIPAAGETQTHFSVASIILSADRLLTEDEMAFFDYMAARGEATNELPYTLGLASGVTKPFYLANSRPGHALNHDGPYRRLQQRRRYRRS